MEGKWKWAIGQTLAENNSQQHMAGHQKCSPPWRISLEIPEEFWAYHFHRWLRHRRRSPLLLPVCQVSCRQRKDPQLPGNLLWPGRALWKPFSLLKHWYSCSGNDRFPCGLKAAKCACVAVTLSQQRCPCSVWEAQSTSTGSWPSVHTLKMVWAVWPATVAALLFVTGKSWSMKWTMSCLFTHNIHSLCGCFGPEILYLNS